MRSMTPCFATLALAVNLVLSGCGGVETPADDAVAVEQALDPLPPLQQAPATVIDPAAPYFSGAAIQGTKVRLMAIERATFVQSFCTSIGSCMILHPSHTVEVNGVKPSLCRRVAGDLECTMSTAISLTSGAVQTVRVTTKDSGGTHANTRSFTAFRCRPQVTSVAPLVAGTNHFLVQGTGLWPEHPDASLRIRALELAQQRPIASIPVVNVSDFMGAVRFALSHPRLDGKVLQFEVAHVGCTGHRYSNAGDYVLKAPGQTTTSDSAVIREYRMPGASDSNAPLDISAQPTLYDVRLSRVEGAGQMLVGSDYSMRWYLINRGSAPISNIELEVSTTSPVALGYVYGGTLLTPQLVDFGNLQQSLPVTCTSKTATTYRCQIASLPQGVLWQLGVAIHGVGTQGATPTVALRAWGGGATEQYNPVTVTVKYDPSISADPQVSSLSLESAVVPGQSYDVPAFESLQHVLKATISNAGPATLSSCKVHLSLVAQHPTYGSYWDATLPSLPAGCLVTYNSRGVTRLECSLTTPLPSGQSLTLSIPFRLSYAWARSHQAWCSPDVLPLPLSASATVTTNLLDMNHDNNARELSQPLCATQWEVSSPLFVGQKYLTCSLDH